MTDSQCAPVTVSRRIGASAHEIFQLLASPARHPDLDGSGMVRQGEPGVTVSGVGDVFVMKMYYVHLGDYEMDNHVVEYERDRRIGWEPAAGRGHPEAGSREGHRWIFELTPDGPDATVVTEIYDCSRAPEELRQSVGNGHNWKDSMTRTLERLDALCTQPGPG